MYDGLLFGGGISEYHGVSGQYIMQEHPQNSKEIADSEIQRMHSACLLLITAVTYVHEESLPAV